MKNEAKEILDQVIEWRRHFHKNPEIGLETVKTEAYIVDELKKMNIDDIRQGIGGHGVRAVISGGLPGKNLALRADCDALPIREETGLPFASNNGNMHACGHDAHSAMLLGTARLLSSRKDQLKGKVILIFQPAEEQVIGAKAMIDDGLLEGLEIDEIIGVHTGLLWKEFQPGELGIKYGSMMASLDRFKITLKGKGGHGAIPHMTVDPISMAGQLIVKLQTIVSREKDPLKGAVMSIGSIQGGTAFNIIPGECILEGTVRTLDPETRILMEERITEISKATASSMRGEVDIEYIPGPPPLINDTQVLQRVQTVAENILGKEKVREIQEPSLGSEDFAYFLEKVPGAFIFHSGCNAAKGQTYPHHNSRFDIDEETLWVGPALFAGYALTWQE